MWPIVDIGPEQVLSYPSGQNNVIKDPKWRNQFQGHENFSA